MVRTRRSSESQTPQMTAPSKNSTDTARTPHLEDTANRRSSRVSKDAADQGEIKGSGEGKGDGRKRSRESRGLVSPKKVEDYVVAKGDFEVRIPSCGGEIFSPIRSGEGKLGLREVELGFQRRCSKEQKRCQVDEKNGLDLVRVIKSLKDKEHDLPPRYTMGTCNLDNPDLVSFEARHAEVQNRMESLAVLKSAYEGSPARLHAALLKLNESVVGYILFSMKPTAIGTAVSEPAAKIVKVLTDGMHEASIHKQRMIKWFTNNYAPSVKYFAAASSTSAMESALDAIGCKRIKGDQAHGIFVAPD